VLVEIHYPEESCYFVARASSALDRPPREDHALEAIENRIAWTPEAGPVRFDEAALPERKISDDVFPRAHQARAGRAGLARSIRSGSPQQPRDHNQIAAQFHDIRRISPRVIAGILDLGSWTTMPMSLGKKDLSEWRAIRHKFRQAKSVPRNRSLAGEP